MYLLQAIRDEVRNAYAQIQSIPFDDDVSVY